jgi:hypothetical protein
LALLVTRIFAHDAHDAFPADDTAGFAELFDGGTDFHYEDTGKKQRNSPRHDRRVGWGAGMFNRTIKVRKIVFGVFSQSFQKAGINARQ